MKKIDFHVHILDPISAEDSASYFRDYCLRKDVEAIGIMACTENGEHLDCNEQAMAIHRLLPNSYVFAALLRNEDFVEQAKRYMREGFHGIKLLDGKPSEYRYYGYGIDDPRYEPFFAYAEQEEIPLLFHNNDPARFWDRERMTPYELEQGWLYDESLPPHEDFFCMIENVLAKHPRLRIALAHFGFYADDLERASRLLEAYPNLMLDATPALCIFEDLSATPEQTRAFFIRYHDRIFYGTDVYNEITGSTREKNDQKTALMQAFYEGDAPLTYGKYSVKGMQFDPSLLQEIYCDNALRFIGQM